jgi:hypothetical protein
MNKISEQLAQAPQHVQLAIDLIMLLEQHDLDPADVIAALDIVKSDFINKQGQNEQSR